MTAGRGFVALAAAIMGMGSALGTAAAALLLAAAETAAIALQAAGLPFELLQAIPYIVPAVVLTSWAIARRRALFRGEIP
jgi:simple sugar transport system permease protein